MLRLVMVNGDANSIGMVNNIKVCSLRVKYTGKYTSPGNEKINMDDRYAR